MSKSLSLEATFAGAPSANRAQPLSVSTDASGTQFAYGTANVVLVRSVEDPLKVLVCNRHTAPVTCVRMAPSGFFVASGDREGNVIVWANKSDTVEKLNFKPLAGRIRDIAWSDDQERMVVVGEGRSNFATVFSVNGGNTLGTVSGHTQNAVSCDFRKDRPFRVITSSADSTAKFFEGPPFKFHHTVSGFKNAVNCVRFSPDSTMIAAVSSAPEVVILDGKTGEKQKTIPTSHKGSTYSIAWSACSTQIVTCGADKAVSGYSVVDGTQLFFTNLGNALMDMQQGVSCTLKGWMSTSLGGDLTFLDVKGSVQATWKGHSRPILDLAAVHGSIDIISVGVDGNVLSWTPEGVASKLSLTQSDTIAGFCCTKDGTIWCATDTSISSLQPGASEGTVIVKDASIGIRGVTVLADGSIVVMYKSSFIIYNCVDGSKVAEEKLPQGFDSSSIASNGNVFAIGGEKLVHVYEAGAGLKQVFDRHTTSVTALAFSSNGTMIASGDSNRQIHVWSITDASVLYTDLVFHSMRISCLNFSPRDDLLASGSVDSSVILWDLANKTHITKDNAHRGGVSAVLFANDQLYTAGGDNCIRRWRWE